METYNTNLQDFLYSLGIYPVYTSGSYAEYAVTPELGEALDNYYIRTVAFKNKQGVYV